MIHAQEARSQVEEALSRFLQPLERSIQDQAAKGNDWLVNPFENLIPTPSDEQSHTLRNLLRSKYGYQFNTTNGVEVLNF